MRTILLIATGIFFYLLARPVFAGGDTFELPMVNGRCQPTVIPEDLKEGWKWIKVHERMDVAKGKNEVQPFQVMHCIEFSKGGAILREYMIASEWYRPIKRTKK